ncbi:MAG: hypothetical protein RL403_209 [Bacteroidota bacterium]|jgi:GNAT superfamily N-acetyltransferase
MVQLRQITKEELSKVQRIAHQTWPSTFGAILSAEQIAYMLNWMYDLSLLESQVEKGHTFLIAEEQEMAVGFAGFELFYKGGSKAKLHKLYLLPSSHGKGIGKALLQEVAIRARAAGQQSLTLNVNQFNQKAIDFYTSQGFVEIYKEVIDIGNGYVMDDAVMELVL